MSMFDLDELIRTDAPEDWSAHLSYLISSMVKTARLAMENDNSGVSPEERMNVAANTLEAAEVLLGIATDGCELMQRKTGHGIRSRALRAGSTSG